MDQRPTIEIVLPITQAKVILYQYLRVKDNREIKKTILGATKIELDENGKPKEGQEFSGSLGIELQALTYELIVKEAYTKDGTKIESIKEFIEELPESDGDVLFAKADELTKKSELSKEAKKK